MEIGHGLQEDRDAISIADRTPLMSMNASNEKQLTKSYKTIK